MSEKTRKSRLRKATEREITRLDEHAALGKALQARKTGGEAWEAFLDEILPLPPDESRDEELPPDKEPPRYCQSCEKTFDPPLRFCESCGQPLHELEVEVSTEEFPEEYPNEIIPVMSGAFKPKGDLDNTDLKESTVSDPKVRKFRLYIVVVIIVVLISAFGYVTLYTGAPKSRDKNNHVKDVVDGAKEPLVAAPEWKDLNTLNYEASNLDNEFDDLESQTSTDLEGRTVSYYPQFQYWNEIIPTLEGNEVWVRKLLSEDYEEQSTSHEELFVVNCSVRKLATKEIVFRNPKRTLDFPSLRFQSPIGNSIENEIVRIMCR